MMVAKASYLQIVGRKSSVEMTRRSRLKPAHQLSLSFPSPDTLLAMDGSVMSREVLLMMFSQSAPAWLFDLRSSPRLDRVAGNREQAFAVFNGLGIHYVDVLGLTGATSRTSLQRNPIEWMPIVQGMIGKSAKRAGPFLAVFDNRQELMNTAPYLVSALSAALGRTIELSSAA